MKTMFKWRHQYDIEADTKEGDAAALKCDDPSLTQQSFTEDADLNVIAKRFGMDMIPSQPLDPRLFRDTTADPDLRDVLEYQRAARDAFQALPTKLRNRFHNSPEELWAFVTDPENAEESVRLGLLAQPAAPASSSTTEQGGAAVPPSAGATVTPPEQPPKGA